MRVSRSRSSPERRTRWDRDEIGRRGDGDRTGFEEALLKAVRSLEVGRTGLAAPQPVRAWMTKGWRPGCGSPTGETVGGGGGAAAGMGRRAGERPLALGPVVRAAGGRLVAAEAAIADRGFGDADSLAAAKRLGFSDEDLARLVGRPEEKVRERRRKAGRSALSQSGHLRGRVRGLHTLPYGSFGTSTRCPNASDRRW